jgi:hypothetical protein
VQQIAALDVRLLVVGLALDQLRATGQN